MKYIIDQEKCNSCGDCINNCHAGAISSINGKVQIDDLRCVACSACFDLCPEHAVETAEEPLTEKDCIGSSAFQQSFMSINDPDVGVEYEPGKKQYSHILEPQKEIPVVGEYDVVVVGGGVAGISAALAAARNGSRACLIEKEICLGGLATMGLVVVYLPLCDGKGHQLIGGIGEELIRNSLKYGPGEISECWNPGGDIEERKKKRFRTKFNAASFMISVEELLVEAGVTVFYNCRFSNVKKDNGRITEIILDSKDGRVALRCKAIVDATGDADVCAVSGEKTVVFKKNIRTVWFYSYDGKDLKLHPLTDDMYHISVNQPLYNGVNQADIFRFNYDGHQMIMDKIRQMQREKGRNVYPVLIPTQSDFLMTRRLKTSFELDEKHERMFFPDSIGMCEYWLEKGHLYYVPLSALTAEKTANLITAGRCISTTNRTWDVIRVIPVCAMTGEAAGTASSLIARSDGDFHNIDIIQLQQVLKSQGAIIDHSLIDK